MSDLHDLTVTSADIESEFEGMLVGAQAGVVFGWVWHPAFPDRAVEVEIFGAGVLLGSATANMADALQPAAVSGNHAFRVAVDPKGLVHPYSIRARVKDSKIEIDGQIDIHTPERHREALVPVDGAIHGVYEGCVVGWAVGRAPGKSILGVDLICEGRQVARGLANADGPATDSGTSGHGFKLPIPSELLDGGAHTLSVKIADSSIELDGSPLSICLTSTGGLLTRLDRLEDGLRRLEDRLEEQRKQGIEAYEKTGRALARRFDAMYLVQRDGFERELSTMRHLLVEDHQSLDQAWTDKPARTVVFDESMIGYGWDSLENDAGIPFRWMGKSASVVVDFDDHAAAILTVKFYLLLDREHASTLRLSVNGVDTTDRHVEDVDGRPLLRVNVPPAAFRGRFCAVVAFEAKFTRRPSEGDQRELSVAVASVQLERAPDPGARR